MSKTTNPDQAQQFQMIQEMFGMMQTMSQRLINVENLAIENKQQISGVITMVENLESCVNLVINKVDGIDTKFEAKINEVEAKLEAKIDAVDDKVKIVEAKVDVVNTKIDAMDKKFEDKIDAVDSRLQIVEAKVDKVIEKVDKVDNRLQVVETKVDTINQQVEVLSENDDAREQELAHLQVNVGKLRLSYQKLADKVAKIGQQ